MKIGDMYWIEGYEAKVERIENAHVLLSVADNMYNFWRGKDYVEHHLPYTPVTQALAYGGSAMALVVGTKRFNYAHDLKVAWLGRPGAPFIDVASCVTPHLDDDGVLSFDGTSYDPFSVTDRGGVVLVVPEDDNIPWDVANKFDCVIDADTGEIT